MTALHLSFRLCLAATLVLALAAPAARAQGVPPGMPQAGGQILLSDTARLLPAIAERGMVASQEAKATRIGVEIRRQGVNAVDASVAVGFALAVTLPRAGNLGGGGFMLVHLAERNEPVPVAFRATAPAPAPAAMFPGPDGEPAGAASIRGGKAVGVPGSVRGMAE